MWSARPPRTPSGFTGRSQAIARVVAYRPAVAERKAKHSGSGPVRAAGDTDAVDARVIADHARQVQSASPDGQVTILAVEDDPAVLEFLEQGLSFAGFDVVTARSGSVALHEAATRPPDLIVLDVVLPDIDGFEVCRRLRADGDRVPVIFLTSLDTDEDVLAGFAEGGDDYLTKPFRLKELVARMLAVLKRTRPELAEEGMMTFSDVRLDDNRHLVSRGESTLELSPTEFRLLRYFLLNPEVALSKDQILDHVWGPDHAGDSRRVETYISYLRRKLGSPPLIHTIWGVGYALRQAPE